MRITYSVELSV